jgi:hypothetical protein
MQSAPRRAGIGWGLWMMVAVVGLMAACNGGPETRSGILSGRALIAPGVPLVGARVLVDQIDLYDGKGELRRHVSETLTDQNGDFEAMTNTASGLFDLNTAGGTFRDPISDALIQVDGAVGMHALHWLWKPFDTRGDLFITPAHSLIEARFKFKVGVLKDTRQALTAAYEQMNQHLGGVDWETIIPADLQVKAIGPTEDIRASFVLGGLAVLADDLRGASDSSPQVINVITMLDAARQDLRDQWLDGNDGNNKAFGSGLQVGECPPLEGCEVQGTGCLLGACRPRCDQFANTFRDGLSASIRKYIGSKDFPSPWNHTGITSLDARPMIDAINRNPDADLFGGACIETADRIPPSITWEVQRDGRWLPLLDGEFARGVISVRAVAIDDAEALPTVLFEGRVTNGRPANSITEVIDTGAQNGALPITAVARDAAGNSRRSTRTFEMDNLAPVIGVATSGYFVDATSGVWWTAEMAPVLRGTITELHPKDVQVVIDGVTVATATIEGNNWSALIPVGKVSSSTGTEVTIRATDAAGNVATVARQLRLDATPPSVLVESSPVYDEAQSTEDYSLDDAAANTWLQRHVTGGAPIDLAQSMPGACATVRKFAHLLFQDFVLGSTGALNAIKLNLVMSDDGVGVAPGTEQVRVSIKNGSTSTEVLPWATMSGIPLGGNATRYNLGLYRDGAFAIPSLGTTEGEYHVEVRGTDKLGRTTIAERCWNHRVLAPKLRPTPGLEGGARAQGFAQAMFSTSLNPGPGEFGDFSAKFLNPTAAGAAVWSWQVKNYLAAPVYVTVTIAKPVNADVYKKFVIRNGLVNYRADSAICGASQCPIGAPANLYTSPEEKGLHENVVFRARLFAMNGSNLGTEILPCTGCTNDDANQVYTFRLPARATAQGAPLAEYAVLTYMRATLPVDGGTNVLMAPRDATQADTDGYSEFVLEGQTLTGKLIGPPGLSVCTAQEFDAENNRWVCTQKATRQVYRALISVNYDLRLDVITEYRTSADPTLPHSVTAEGRLRGSDPPFVTAESTALP